MRPAVLATAPGKAVLSGEYAVLDGAPAICMAVDRRAVATVGTVAGGLSSVTAPGLTDVVGRFSATDGAIRWQSPPEPFVLIDAIWRVTGSGSMHGNSWSIDLDTREFVDSASGRKLGVGSSAAITVALCAAVCGIDDPVGLMTTAQRVHADLQGGKGSGVDIACSLYGGLIEYRREATKVTSTEWPPGLHCRFIWTGVPTSTHDKLAKLDASVSHPSRSLLAHSAEDMAVAWQSGDAARILAEYRDYTSVLREFSVDHDLGIFDAGHDELRRRAIAADLVYKPCGAGGGDIGILIGSNETEIDNMLRHLPAGHQALDCQLSEAGVLLQEPPATTQ